MTRRRFGRRSLPWRGGRLRHGAARATPYKVAWIYVGPHNDGGWSQAHDDGTALRPEGARQQGADDLQGEHRRRHAVRPDRREPGRAGLQDDLRDVVRLPVEGVRREVPERDLRAGDRNGYRRQNLAEYFGAAEDTVFLSGMAAGAASKTGNIGYVVAFPIPEVIRHADAFALGAQLTHPGAKVQLVWTNSWYDPAKEKKAAESLVSAGADVLGQNVDSTATGQVAKSSTGSRGSATTRTPRTFAPKSWLTASVYNWGPYYLKRVKAAMAGTWKPGFYYGSIKDGFTALAPYGPGVCAKTKALIAAKQTAIETGKFYEFTGPLYDQSGKLMVKPGVKLTVNQLYSMNWLVKGVIGSPKG